MKIKIFENKINFQFKYSTVQYSTVETMLLHELQNTITIGTQGLGKIKR